MNAQGRRRLVTGVAAVVSACVMGAGKPGENYESFEDGVPAGFTASRAGSLSPSPWHYRHGTNSLRWDWAGGEELVIRRGIGDPTRTRGFLNRAAFVVCVYMEAPSDGALLFSFQAGDKVTGSFRFPLRFTGWRQARLFYDTFPQGRPTADVDRIRITAPDAVPRGTTFFDVFRYNTLIYYSAAIIPEEVAQWRRPEPDPKRFPRPDRVSEAERAGLLKLGGGPAGAPAGIADERVNELCGSVKALGIVRGEHGVRGPSLVRTAFYYAGPGEYGGADIKGWPDEYGPDGPEIGLPGPEPAERLAKALATAHGASQDDRQRARIAEVFLLLADYFLDQGLSLDLESIIATRDVLAQMGRLQPHLDAQMAALRAGDFFVEEGVPVNATMDFYASTGPYRLRNMLRLCFAQRDEAERVRWMNAWKAMLDRSLLQPEGPFKPDGSAYHHRGFYPSYAQNAFGNLPSLLTQIKDTPWMPSAEALEPLRRAMLAQRLYCNKLSIPIALTGRSPFAGGIYEGILPNFTDVAFDAVARLGTPDGKQSIDPELAAAFLRLVPGTIDKEPYRGLGIQPEPDPQGTFSMPYAALLCHRRTNWLVSVKGQSKYVWGSERQARRNAYGLFLGLGNLEILAGGDPVSAAASGRSGAGWDWRRFEGTTAPQLPLEEIDKGWSFVSGTLRSPETFAGGLSFQGRHGIFGMILNQTIAPGTHTLRGRKSWFFEDDRIVCLGSDIAFDDARHPTQTTLCQKALATNEQGTCFPTLLDGADFSAFPEERALDHAKAHWFLDVQQTGYILPAGQNGMVARRRQLSRDVDDVRDTEGAFLTAWIDHGKGPGGAGYEYMAVVRTTAAAMRELAAKPPYRVIQRDQSAHIVHLAAAGRWGCVFFVPQQVAPRADGAAALPIQAVDRPCLMMAETGRDGRLDLSVADPDLNLENEVSKARPLRVTLRGKWRLLKATGTVCAWLLPEAPDGVRILSADATATELEILCRHGASYDIRLASQ